MEALTAEQQRAEQQRASFASWAEAPDPLQKRGSAATPQQVEYFNQLISSQQRISMMQEQPVTVVNLNPYDLMVLHPLFDGLKVKANKEGDAFSALVIKTVKYQVNQGLDRNHTPVEFWPIQMAAEFSARYAEKGGVFHINGNLEKNPELQHTAEFKRLFKQAEESLISYCRKLKAAADNEWATPNRAGQRNIHFPHRQAARILLAKRLLSKVPEWMDGDVSREEDVVPDCPICKAEPKKGALVCPNCHYCLNPRGAFLAGIIPETDAALERLTRKDVEALGVSAFVAETADEKPKRLAAKLPKPQSEFEREQQAKLDAEIAPAKKGTK